MFRNHVEGKNKKNMLHTWLAQHVGDIKYPST